MVAVGLIASLFFSMLIISFKNCVKKTQKPKTKQNKKSQKNIFKFFQIVIFSLVSKLGCLSLLARVACLENSNN